MTAEHSRRSYGVGNACGHRMRRTIADVMLAMLPLCTSPLWGTTMATVTGEQHRMSQIKARECRGHRNETGIRRGYPVADIHAIQTLIETPRINYLGGLYCAP